jgi:hypothetical protein
MKNLIYSSALLCVFISITSCNKGDLVNPRGSAPVEQAPIGKSICDSTKSINYVINNATSVNSFQVLFLGATTYTFRVPANGSITVAVKPGRYDVQIPATGNYAKHNFYLNGETVLESSGAHFGNLNISSCSAQAQISIE